MCCIVSRGSHVASGIRLRERAPGESVTVVVVLPRPLVWVNTIPPAVKLRVAVVVMPAVSFCESTKPSTVTVSAVMSEVGTELYRVRFVTWLYTAQSTEVTPRSYIAITFFSKVLFSFEMSCFCTLTSKPPTALQRVCVRLENSPSSICSSA